MKNLKRTKKIVSILLAISMILALLIPISASFAADNNQTEQTNLNEDLEYIGRMIEFIQSRYLDEITEEELIEGAMKGIFSKLDDYSSYYTEGEYKDLTEKVSGDFGGIGIQVVEKEGYITVVTPLDGTPGFRAGIKPNDKVISVDETDITGYSLEKAVGLMRGEEGTTIKLGILREGTEGVIYFDIIREIIKINPVSYKILENDIGYIRIAQFNGNTFENVIKALNEFDSKNIEKITIDLRNNPGGSLQEVVNTLRLFIPEGPIVHINNSDGTTETHNSYLKNPKYKLAVLVNGGSASASEIFAGAVKDTKVGTIIGTTTFGKGIVQSLYPISNGGGIKITVAEYLTPNKNKVHGIGITPDIVIENIIEESKIDLTKIPTLNKERKPNIGTMGLDVLGAEQILEILGYNVNKPDGILDEVTFNEIKSFQIDQGLFGYGILDFSTQDELTKEINIRAKSKVIDNQLEQAITTLFE